MNAYSPDKHTPVQNGNQRQLFSIQQAPDGQISFVITPSHDTVASIGNFIAAFAAASGNAVVPSGYQPPPTPADEEKQRFEARQAEIGRESRRIGRIASSRHRKLLVNGIVSWYAAAKLIAPDFGVSTEILKHYMKFHREARDGRLQRARECLANRLKDEGLSDAVIGERFGVHSKTIGAWRKKEKAKRNALRQEASQ